MIILQILSLKLTFSKYYSKILAKHFEDHFFILKLHLISIKIITV